MAAITTSSTQHLSAREPLMAALVAALLGTLLVLGAGFAPLQTAHDAAHDSRHAFAFPCH